MAYDWPLNVALRTGTNVDSSFSLAMHVGGLELECKILFCRALNLDNDRECAINFASSKSE